MDPLDLARWTRFAAKGGIGRCTALADCMAENEGDLMFLHGDEITVLMQLDGQQGKYLGFCEGVVGRFSGADVRFHAKLKKPVMTKRSSMSSNPAGKSSPSRGEMPAPVSVETVASPCPSPPPPPPPLPPPPPPTSISVDGTIDQILSLNNVDPRASMIPPQVTAPLSVPKKPSPSPLSPSFTFPTSTPPVEELSYGTYENSSTRLGDRYDDEDDAEVGIGLTMLQALADGDDDDDEDEDEDDPSERVLHQPPPAQPNPNSPAQSTFSGPHVRTPSLAHSVASSGSWEGAIYDDYRYSRYSVASKLSRFSSMSNVGAAAAASSTSTSRPPVPDSRPSVDSESSFVRAPARFSSLPGVKLPSRPPIPLTLQPKSRDQLLPSPTTHVSPPHPPPLPDPVPSPLLHTNWGSSSSSAHDSGASYYTMSSVRDSGGGKQKEVAVGQVRSNTVEEIPKAVPVSRHPTDETEKGSIPPGEVTERNGPIVIEDDEEIPSHILSSTLHDSPSSSPELSYDATEHGDDVALPTLLPPSSPSPSPPPSPPPVTTTTLTTTTPLATQPGLRGERILETNARQSLFLPHPNAPKPPPSSEAAGPMYLQTPQEREKRLSMAFITLFPPSSSSRPHSPNVPGSMHPPSPSFPNPPPQRLNSVDVVHAALAKLSQQASRGQAVAARAPPPWVTIYGRTEVDLDMSYGPVPIVFSIEPFPATAPRPNAVQYRQNTIPAAAAPPRSTSLGTGGRAAAVTRAGTEVERSFTFSSREAASVTTGVSIAAESITQATEITPEAGAWTQADGDETLNNTLPRSNFFPKPPGVRPRSRSFSGFDTGGGLDLTLNGFTQSDDVASESGGLESGEERRDIIKRSSSSQNLNSPSLLPGAKSSPLRPSPLSLVQNNLHPRSEESERRDSPVVTLDTAPSSTPSLSSGPSPLPPVSGAPALSLQTTGSSSQLPSSPLSPAEPSLSEKLWPRPSVDTDAVSVNSDSRSFLAPSITTRKDSLRSKLSLPNLRKQKSRQDETSSLASSGHLPDPDTVQVQDMDFELIRPSIPSLASRNSEDPRREGLLDPYPSPGLPGSPAVSTFSNRSATAASENSAWPSPCIDPVPIKPTTGDAEQLDAHRQRELKWISLLSSVSPSQSKKTKKIKKLLFEGVPASVRYLVWTHVTNGRERIVTGVFSQLCSRGAVAASNVITADVQRCFREHPQLQGARSPVLIVLQAYLNMVPDVQYTKGLTLIMGQLLLQGPEEEVFWIFVSLMDSYLRPYFSINSTQLEVDATLFSRALESNDAQVAKRMLMDMSIAPDAICSSWFTSVFVDSLPLDYVNRVWDIFMYEGIPFLIRVGLAVVHCCRRQVFECPDERSLLELIHHPPPRLLPPNPDAFISLALNQKVKDDDFRKQRVKMEAQVKRQTQAQAPRKSTAGTMISFPKT